MAQAQKTQSADRTEEAVQPPGSKAAEKAAQERGDKLKAEMDALLEEIDGVLESDAETFVRGYVQKGGE